jgi:hypothetical protein
MPHHKLQSIISELQLSPNAILYLLQQGIEVEKLRLEFLQSANAESIESHCRILQGEQFASILTVASLS